MALAQQEIDVLNEYVTLKAELEQLKAKEKALCNEVKDILEAHSVTNVVTNGACVQAVETSRMTLKKAQKDAFIAAMKQIGRTDLIEISTDINKDVLKSDIDAGILRKEDLSQYVTFSTGTTIKVAF